MQDLILFSSLSLLCYCSRFLYNFAHALHDIDLKQTRFYQEVFAEGEREGRYKEGAALILRLLQRCCGELAPPIREQVSQLSLLPLEALGAALLEYRGLADLEQWLAMPGSRAEI